MHHRAPRKRRSRVVAALRPKGRRFQSRRPDFGSSASRNQQTARGDQVSFFQEAVAAQFGSQPTRGGMLLFELSRLFFWQIGLLAADQRLAEIGQQRHSLLVGRRRPLLDKLLGFADSLHGIGRQGFQSRGPFPSGSRGLLLILFELNVFGGSPQFGDGSRAAVDGPRRDSLIAAELSEYLAAYG